MFPIDTSPSDVVRWIMESRPRSFPINVLDLKRGDSRIHPEINSISRRSHEARYWKLRICKLSHNRLFGFLISALKMPSRSSLKFLSVYKHSVYNKTYTGCFLLNVHGFRQFFHRFFLNEDNRGKIQGLLQAFNFQHFLPFKSSQTKTL